MARETSRKPKKLKKGKKSAKPRKAAAKKRAKTPRTTAPSNMPMVSAAATHPSPIFFPTADDGIAMRCDWNNGRQQYVCQQIPASDVPKRGTKLGNPFS